MIDVRAIRRKLGLSQPDFARRFGFSVATIRQWEQGRRRPHGPTMVLLIVIKHNPGAVIAALEESETCRSLPFSAPPDADRPAGRARGF